MILEAVPGREVRTARKSAITTQGIAARVCGIGETAYNRRELDQEKFEVGELRRLYAELGTDGRDTLWAWLEKIFPRDVN